MRTSLTLVAACVTSLIGADLAAAQPHPSQGRQDRTAQDRWADQGRDNRESGSRRGGQDAQSYYYNGRWVSADEWRRRSPERDRWAQNHQRRRGNDNSDASALIAGIIGFALGAAIVGSQQQVEHARGADESWDSYCAKKYRSYDRRSRTYMGNDGVRHYCQ